MMLTEFGLDDIGNWPVFTVGPTMFIFRGAVVGSEEVGEHVHMMNSDWCTVLKGML